MNRTGGLLLSIVIWAVVLPFSGEWPPRSRAEEDQRKIVERWELVPPEGYELYGGADIESRVDGAGKIFVSATGETSRGFGGLMWVQQADGAGGWKSTPIDLGELYPGGRGSLSVENDGQLYLTQWGHKSQAWRLRIAAWKPLSK
jgi:hypothetical protein